MGLITFIRLLFNEKALFFNDSVTEEKLMRDVTKVFATRYLLKNGGPVFEAYFDSYCSPGRDKYWTEDSCIQALKNLLPGYISSELASLGPPLFRSLHHLAAFPFPPQPGTTLSREELFRGASLMRNGNSAFSGPSDWEEVHRERSSDEWHRVLFQSFATTGKLASSLKQTQADDNEHLTDIIDTMETINYIRIEDHCSIPVAWRKDVIPLAERLCRSPSTLDNEAISAQDLLMLLELLMAWDTPKAAAGGCLEASRCLLAAFSPDADGDVRWPVFRDVINNSMPWLFRWLKLIIGVLFEQEQPRLSPASNYHGMDVVTANQLYLFLPPQAASGSFMNGPCLYTRHDGDNLGDLAAKVTDWAGPSVLLVHCSTPANKKFILGAYLPVRWQQGFDTYFGSQLSMLFQLAPSHNVFQTTKKRGNEVWLAYNDQGQGGIGFGCRCPPVSDPNQIRHGPVSLVISADMKTAVFTQNNSEGASYQLGNANTAGESKQLHLCVNKLGVWAFKDEDYLVAESEERRRRKQEKRKISEEESDYGELQEKHQ